MNSDAGSNLVGAASGVGARGVAGAAIGAGARAKSGAWSFGVGATSGADSKNGIGTSTSTAGASASAKLWVRCCSWEITKSALREWWWWWQLGNCQWQWNIRRRHKGMGWPDFFLQE